MQYKIFGCKVNKYYTDEWLKSSYLKDKNGVFIASCVVTDKAKKKWVKFLKDTSEELKKGEKIYLSGCGSIDKGKSQNNFYEIYPELEELKDKIELLDESPSISNPFSLGEKGDKKLPSPLGGGIEGGGLFTKKFLLIQGGCDSFCSFCLTVLKRGRHYSRDKDEIVNEILEFEKAGGKEVVLTGVNLCAWGSSSTNDIKDSKFNELLKYILEKTSIPRIRISSLGPEFINDETLELFKNTRIYPHFHYSVQSGSSKILKAMNRHYDGKYIRNLLEKTKNLQREDGVEVSIGADLIVGFPGETEKDFMETYSLVEDSLITKCHIFPFSSHKIGESVPASKFPEQVDEEIKKDRAWRLEAIGDEKREEFIDRNTGKELQVLVEFVEDKSGKLKWKGWTENYIEATEENFEIIFGKIERNAIIKGILI